MRLYSNLSLTENILPGLIGSLVSRYICSRSLYSSNLDTLNFSLIVLLVMLMSLMWKTMKSVSSVTWKISLMIPLTARVVRLGLSSRS